jgi:hypothetical protein
MDFDDVVLLKIFDSDEKVQAKRKADPRGSLRLVVDSATDSLLRLSPFILPTPGRASR